MILFSNAKLRIFIVLYNLVFKAIKFSPRCCLLLLLLLLLWFIFLFFVVPIQSDPIQSNPIQSKQTGGFGFWTDDLMIMDVEERHTSLLPQRSCFTLFVVQAQWWVRIFVGLKRHILKSDARVVVVGNAVNNMMLLSALLFIIVAGIEYTSNRIFLHKTSIDWRRPLVVVGGQSTSGANASTSAGTASLRELITKHTDFLPQGFIFPSSFFYLSTYFD